MSKIKEEVLDITGKINVQTENILPIIKKWLYSDHEIFIRELISNSFDAINKLNKIATIEKLPEIKTDGKINIQINEKEKQLIISDNGLGMDADEIQKYICQIAFSGAEDFIKKYKDKEEKNQIIGHFGLGFFSAYMVADVVEINSLSYKKEATPIHWSCEGSTDYKINASEKKEIGTDIILNINKDNEDFLNEARITGLIKKYANFLPIEIQLNGKTINDQAPLWIKKPVDVEKKEYEEFYQKLFPFSQPPLFWIHLNVDFPFNLKGVLYFPQLLHEMDSQKGQVNLYCQQVFVTENANEVIPEFLTLLRGAIDCPEIPLNVSRSYLQNDPYVQKISKHIIKKVADKLSEIFKTDRTSFEKYWEDINPFIKYGMMNNNDFYEKVKDIVIFPNSEGASTTIPEYLERNKEKNDNSILYCTDKESQAAYVNMCKEQGLEVIYQNSVIDNHFMQFLESKNSDLKFNSVDSSLSDILVDKDKESEIIDPADNKTANDKIIDIFKNALNNDKLTLKVESLKTENISAIVLESEQMKRMKAMTMMMKEKSFPMMEDLTLVINSSSQAIQNILKLNNDGLQQEKVNKLCHHVYDLALMSQQPLSGEKMHAFVSRANELLL
jgi:molecular chaperone HtpG